MWFVDKPARNDLHPTMKPVALVERAIRNSSKSRDIVLDPFGGSGSTLIACEKAGRQARLVELDPRYCGLADRVEKPVRMAAHFDRSQFRNTPPQLAAMSAGTNTQEDDRPDPKNKRSGRSVPTAQVDQDEVRAETAQTERDSSVAARQPSETEATPEHAPTPQATSPGHSAPEPAPQPSAQVIDLDAVRAEERNATLAYVAEVHELCAIAGRDDLAAGFVAKATPVAQIRRALLEARAAEDEASAIRSQVRPSSVEPPQPAIDTQAIYAARNQHCR